MNRLHIHSIGKRWRKPQLHRTGKPAGWTALLLLLLLPAACIQDEPAPAVGEGEYMVRLLIDPQTVATRAPGDETGVSGIHQLRVYVFKGQTRVGYYENMYLQATGQAYYVPFRLTEGGNLDFYVVANEDAASTEDSQYDLTENTSKETLERAGFLVENIGRNPGDLLTGKTQAQVPGTDIPEGQVQQVTCALSRPYSLLNIFFAKSTATCTATVTGVKLHNYSRYGYFSDRDIATDYTTDRNNNHTEEFTFLSATDEAITVSTVVPEDEQKTGNYGNESFTKPVALDTHGSSEWTTDWENIEQADYPYLEIAYTLNGAKKTANVYLPPHRQDQLQVQREVPHHREGRACGTMRSTRLARPETRLRDFGRRAIHHHQHQHARSNAKYKVLRHAIQRKRRRFRPPVHPYPEHDKPRRRALDGTPHQCTGL